MKASKTVEVNEASVLWSVRHIRHVAETPSFERLLVVQVLHHHFCLDSTSLPSRGHLHSTGPVPDINAIPPHTKKRAGGGMA